MLGRRLPGILPPLTRDEALEVTRIHSVAGTLPAGPADHPRAAVSRSAPRRLGGGDRRWRRRAAARRGEPRAPRRPPARRATRVPTAGARIAAPAARGRRRLGRAGRRPCALPGPLSPRRDDEPLPLRGARRSCRRLRLQRRSGLPPIARRSRARCSIGSISWLRCRDRVPKSSPRRRASRRRRCAHASSSPAQRLRDGDLLRRTAAASALLDRAVERVPLSGRGRARVARVARTVAALADADARPPRAPGRGAVVPLSRRASGGVNVRRLRRAAADVSAAAAGDPRSSGRPLAPR